MGKYGCDAPLSLVQSTLDHAAKLISGDESSGGRGGPAFVIVTGDIVRHGVDQIFSLGDFNEGSESRANTTKATTASSSSSLIEEAVNAPWYNDAMSEAGDVVRTFATMLRATFPNSIIVVCVGNNDVVPDYYLKLVDESERKIMETATTRTLSMGMLSVLYEALGDSSEDKSSSSSSSSSLIIQSTDEPTFLKGGYYSRTVQEGKITILSLNTVLYSAIYEPYNDNLNDPGGQFTWMRSVLSECRNSHSRAILAGHIPPVLGSRVHQHMWRTRYIKTYYDIVKEYDDVIMTQLYGHLHTDEFRVGGLASYEEEIKAGGNDDTVTAYIPDMQSAILLGPSVTPLHGNDPSFRIVRYDQRGEVKEYRLIDYDSHVYSVTANEAGNGGWSKLYTFSEAYGDVALEPIEKEGLSSNTYRAIVMAMEHPSPWWSIGEILETYRSYKLSGAENDANQFGVHGECDRECRTDYYCIFQSATTTAYDHCMIERRTMIQTQKISVIAGVLLSIMIVVCAFAQRRRMRRNTVRKDYEFTPSVHLEEDKDGVIDAHDREMI
jgi:predicted phosphodiesterase